MGERKMADISVMDTERLCGWLPRRARETHKGDFGRILLLCGAVGYTGAPALAAMGAARSGAGLIFVGVPEPVYPIVAGKLLEPMVFPLLAQGGMLAETAVPEILARLSGCDACLIGCGLGRSAGTFAAVQAVLANAACPVVVDADGINVLEGHIDVLRGAACPVVLTPHDGEYRRLMGRLPGEDRVGAAAALAEKTGATVLLKGHRTAICGADERWDLLRAGAATCWRAFSSHCWGRACRPCMQRLRLRGSTERRPTAAPPGWGSTACCPRTLRRSCHIYCHRRGCACGEAAPY